MTVVSRLVVAVLVCLLAVVVPTSASAHSDDGVMAVEQSGVTGVTGEYTVRVTSANDGHPALDATVTASAVGPDGTPLTPVTMEPVDDDGRYRASIEFPQPGRWTVRFTSVTPAATAELREQVTAPSTTTSAEPSSTTTTTAPPDGAGPPSDDESSSNLPWVIAIGALVLVVVAVVLALRARRQPVP